MSLSCCHALGPGSEGKLVRKANSVTGGEVELDSLDASCTPEYMHVPNKSYFNVSACVSLLLVNCSLYHVVPSCAAALTHESQPPRDKVSVDLCFFYSVSRGKFPSSLYVNIR